MTSPIPNERLKSFIRRHTIEHGFHGLMTEAIPDCAECAERLLVLEPWAEKVKVVLKELQGSCEFCPVCGSDMWCDDAKCAPDCALAALDDKGEG